MQNNLYICICLTVLLGTCFAAEPEGPLPPVIEIHPGWSRDEPMLGFGWSWREKFGRGMVRWISHMEADVFFELGKEESLGLELVAAPLYLSWQRQNIGVYINGAFVHEWICPDSPDFATYRTRISDRYLRKGRNTLTLRMGYRHRMPPDERELSLIVDSITLEALPDPSDPPEIP
jgi:hypothetical protein